MIESTLYGLPMLRVNTPSSTGLVLGQEPEQAESRAAPSPSGIQVTRNASVAPGRLSPALTREFDVLTPDASLPLGVALESYGFLNLSLISNNTDDGDFYTLSGTALASPYEPIQPGIWQNLENSLGKAHGAMFWGGDYGDQPNFNPVVETAGNLGASDVITEPAFAAPGFYPAVPLVMNEIATLGGNSIQYLVASAGQFDSHTATERTYDNMTFRVFYSDEAESSGPQIGRAQFAALGSSLQVTVPVTDNTGVYQVYLTYTGGVGAEGHGTWTTSELTASANHTWTGSLPLVSPTWFIVQAVDNAGNVTADDNAGAYYLYVTKVAAPSMSLTSGNPSLRWTHLGDQVARYEVWRGTAPYFTPGDGISTLRASLQPPFAGEPSFTDLEVVPAPGTAFYYVVRTMDQYGRPTAVSGGVGSFSFGLSPGQ